MLGSTARPRKSALSLVDPGSAGSDMSEVAAPKLKGRFQLSAARDQEGLTSTWKGWVAVRVFWELSWRKPGVARGKQCTGWDFLTRL